MINAAKMFEFPDLHAACWEFAMECMRPDTLPLMVEGATLYSQFKETRKLMQKVLHFSLISAWKNLLGWFEHFIHFHYNCMDWTQFPELISSFPYKLSLFFACLKKWLDYIKIDNNVCTYNRVKFPIEQIDTNEMWRISYMYIERLQEILRYIRPF